jgi:hypothetical protein
MHSPAAINPSVREDLRVLFGLLVALSYGSAAFWLLYSLAGRELAIGGALALALLFGSVFARKTQCLRPAFEVLVLLVLVGWGLGVNHLLNASCQRTACDTDETFRFLAEPYVYALLALHLSTVLAYAVSRRPEALHPPAEMVVAALLLVGIALHTLLAVQFGESLSLGLLLPLALPALAPLLTIGLYGAELISRLRRRAETPAAIRWGLLARALATSPALLGAYTVVTALIFKHWAAAASVFTATCDHPLSRLPVETIPC